MSPHGAAKGKGPQSKCCENLILGTLLVVQGEEIGAIWVIV